MILGADVDPIDVYSHLPVLCEEKRLPYIFVSSRRALADSVHSKRVTAGILLTEPQDAKLKESYEKIHKKVLGLNK